MASLYNRARVTTATTGTGTVSLGAAFAGYFTFAEAGVQDADVVAYTIEDGNDFEIGEGTYTASGTTLTRTVTESKIGGVAGTSAINLSGSATVFITARAEDISGDVVGPASATDNAIARYDDTTGKIIQDSGVIIDDSDNVSGAASLTLSGANGVDVNPGSDIDADLLTVGVTGAPTFSWDESADAFKYSKPVIISSDGNGDITHTIAGASVVSDLEVHSEGTADLGGIVVHRHTDTNDFGGHLLFLRSDGTHASPTLVDDGDTLGRIIGLGQDGTDYELGAEIRFVVDGVAANNVMYGAVDIYTNNGGQTLTRRARFRADGSVEIVTGPLTLPNTGLHLLDTNASHDLIIAPGSDLSADRTLTLTTGDTNLILNLTDPGADRLMFWDDTAGQWTALTLTGGLTISGTEIRANESFVIACSDETTDLTTGTAKVTFRMPYAFTLTAVRASVNTAPVGSTIIVDINEAGTTILSTKLTIDASEETSTTAATAAVISDTALADDAEITIDIDQIGSSTAGTGLKVTLIGYRP